MKRTLELLSFIIAIVTSQVQIQGRLSRLTVSDSAQLSSALPPMQSKEIKIDIPIPGVTFGGGGYQERCSDGFFLVTQSGYYKSSLAHLACPPGYRLADVSEDITFRRAVEILFRCQGPFSEAWIGTCELNGAKISTAMRMIAPSAIEKSSLKVIPARIDLAKNTSQLPALCQRDSSSSTIKNSTKENSKATVNEAPSPL